MAQRDQRLVCKSDPVNWVKAGCAETPLVETVWPNGPSADADSLVPKDSSGNTPAGLQESDKVETLCTYSSVYGGNLTIADADLEWSQPAP